MRQNGIWRRKFAKIFRDLPQIISLESHNLNEIEKYFLFFRSVSVSVKNTAGRKKATTSFAPIILELARDPFVNAI